MFVTRGVTRVLTVGAKPTTQKTAAGPNVRLSAWICGWERKKCAVTGCAPPVARERRTWLIGFVVLLLLVASIKRHWSR